MAGDDEDVELPDGDYYPEEDLEGVEEDDEDNEEDADEDGEELSSGDEDMEIELVVGSAAELVEVVLNRYTGGGDSRNT